jgi:hypothetical protein
MKAYFVVALGLQLVTVAPQNVEVIPLIDQSDPVQITDARFEIGDNGQPVLMVRLVNQTETVIATRNVWFDAQRFFTPVEMRRNGDQILFNCGRMGRGEVGDGRSGLAPGDEVSVRLEIPPDCRLDHAHEHFYVHVVRITLDGNYSAAVWAREPAAMAVLFKAARPHP